ncbi:MAG TPA: OmpA family protein [Trebonia sp.]|nr:OmpA family protein [Trebonia sp.]
MRTSRHRAAAIGAAVGVAALLAGCQLSSEGASDTGPATTITQPAVPAALLAVLARPSSGPSLAALVTSTARPREDLRIVQAGNPATTVVASDSPAPAAIVLPGQPLAPTGGQTDYQSAQYDKRLNAWRAQRAADIRTAAAQTRQRTASWVSGLQIAQHIARLANPPASAGSLAAESAVAASAMSGLQQDAGGTFASRRAVVLFPGDLSGALPAGELTGDKVIVVTGGLPSAAAASAAQAELLGAGAAQAAVVGPEVTAAQLAALVAADLGQGGAADTISTPVLFGNNSAALDATAAGQLTRLIPALREPGVTVVIDGYASTAGTAEANYALSYQRATRVADFFEKNGIPSSSLIIVGHGATDSFGARSPDANRRVLVVTEKPAGAT